MFSINIKFISLFVYRQQKFTSHSPAGWEVIDEDADLVSHEGSPLSL